MKPDPVSRVSGLASGFWAALAGLNFLLALANAYISTPISWDTEREPLSLLVIFVIRTCALWLVLSIVLSLMAATALFMARDDRRGSIALGILLPAILVQVCLTSTTLYHNVIPLPFEGFLAPLREQAPALFNLMAGDNLSAWVVDVRSALALVGFAIAMGLYWRFIASEDRHGAVN